MAKKYKHEIDKGWQLLVSKALDDTFFLGWALNEHKKNHNVNKKQLALWLECSPENLNRLALCRFPNDESEYFHRDVQQIADYTSCNPDRLMLLIREVSAVASLKEKGGKVSNGLLMAARDRIKIDEEDEGD